MTDVLLVTSSELPDGEPSGDLLVKALSDRGIDARWVIWDDDTVDWAAADLVVVRSTWDYAGRHLEFIDWVRAVEAGGTRVLNGANVFAWNVDKAYLTRFGDALPVVPTLLADVTADLPAAVAAFGTTVIKPRIGAGGRGLQVLDAGSDLAALEGGPWVVQPLVESIRTEGETSVFVLGGRPVSQVDKATEGDEIRVHPRYGGASRAVELRGEAASLATRAVTVAAQLLRTRIAYARVDMVRLADGTLVVGELELVEPGLYLDVLPENADAFGDVVVSALD